MGLTVIVFASLTSLVIMLGSSMTNDAPKAQMTANVVSQYDSAANATL